MIKKALIAILVLGIVLFGVKYFWLKDSKKIATQVNKKPAPDCETQKADLFEKHLRQVYTETGLDTAGLNYDVYHKAMVGFYNIERKNKINKPVLSVVDFQKKSTEKRLWVFDIDERKLLFHDLVAHGKNTGENTAEDFSNLANSNKSSIGFYLTQNTYIGKHGLSLIINGLENGFNDNAKARSIVVHGANYVSEEYVENVGRCGRSQGCPAVSESICEGLVCTISDRSVMFIYYPDEKYLSESEYLKQQPANDIYASNNFFRCTKYTEVALRY
jgi:hypothetical protein